MNPRVLLVFVLVLALVGTALRVVVLTHTSRQLFTGLSAAALERDEANVEWSRLKLEQAWLADAARIERLAREQLEMHVPRQPRVVLVE